VVPSEIQALRAALVEARAEAAAAKARANAIASRTEAVIAQLKLQILKLRRELYGHRSERRERLLEQMELELEELEASATEDELAVERRATTTSIGAFARRHPSRKPFPEHLPRERVIVPAPTSCACCGSSRLVKIGEDVTETLEVVPRQWKIVATVREKFSCRQCETIHQPPAPFHVLPRGWAGPSLLAMILFEKYGQHQPLNRQSERYRREGVELSLSTLADQVGGCAAALRPLYDRIREHVFAGERVHGDDTPVPVLAKGRTTTGRIWTYVRDDRPFAGTGPPAAVFFYSSDRRGEHPRRHLEDYSGILQADAYSGFGELYKPDRDRGLVREAACWAHGRRKFFELADVARGQRGQTAMGAPLAIEAVRRIDLVFDAERPLKGLPTEERLTGRKRDVAPLLAELETWMREHRAKLSRHADVAKAMDYMLNRWEAFARFLEDGRICATNNAAERALRGLALGRKAWLFCGSDRGGERAAVFYTLIGTAKLNDVDPQAWLADALARIADHPASRLDELLPWRWSQNSLQLAA
jgi:transposase